MDPVHVLAKFEGRIFTRSRDNSGYFKTLDSPWIRRSRWSKVDDLGTNRKRVCEFLLVIHSNLGPMLYRFGDVAGFFVLLTPPLFHHNFRGVPVVPDRPCWRQPAHRPWAIRPWNYFRRMPTYVITIPNRHGRTDGQTDGQTIYCGITALCVTSRGKNWSTSELVIVKTKCANFFETQWTFNHWPWLLVLRQCAG